MSAEEIWTREREKEKETDRLGRRALEDDSIGDQQDRELS
jgi:hypothetical protein